MAIAKAMLRNLMNLALNGQFCFIPGVPNQADPVKIHNKITRNLQKWIVSINSHFPNSRLRQRQRNPLIDTCGKANRVQ
jgi:hypothetical protein